MKYSSWAKNFFPLFYCPVLGSGVGEKHVYKNDLYCTSLCHRPRKCNFSNLCGRCKSSAPEIVSSLCHRPRKCNFSNLCGRCKSSAPEIVRLAALAFRLRRTLAPSALALDFPRASGARIWVNCLESSLWQRLILHQTPSFHSLISIHNKIHGFTSRHQNKIMNTII